MERIVLEFTRAERAGEAHAFRFAPQTYLLRTPGGGFDDVEFPWTRALLDDLRAVRDPARGPEVAHRLGEVLRGFLAGAGWDAHERQIVRAVRAGEPVHLSVRSAAAELYALPWELLALRSTGQLLGTVPGLLVRYEWPDTASLPDRVPAAARSGRVLFAWSAAGGAVPAAEHLAALRDALGARFDARRDVLAHASYPAIADALARAQRDGPPIDALHLLCHGAQAGGGYGLALDDDAGARPVVIDAGRLQQLLAPHAGMLRLVVLAACDSGDAGEPGNLLGSAAQMVHRAGVRALVASRFPLSVAGSSRLAEALYPALARGDTLERAVLDARAALARDPTQLDWASVQLYSREADGDATEILGTFPKEHVQKDIDGTSAPRRRWPWLAAGGALAAGVAAVLVSQAGPASAPQPAEPPIVAAPTAPGPAPSPATPEPAPAPAPEVALEPSSSTTSSPVADDGTTSAPASAPPIEPIAREPTKAPTKATPTSKPKTCSEAVKLYLASRLPAASEPAGKVELDVTVDGGGRLVVRPRGGDASQRAAAADHLDRSDAARLVRLGGDGLPCRTSLVWFP